MSGAFVLALGLVVRHYGAANLHWRSFLIAGGWTVIFFGIPFSVLLALTINRFFPVGFSPDGIFGHSLWGRRSLVRWQDISMVRKFNLANLAYLRIYSGPGGKTIWLPLFQSRSAEFQEEIRKLAPANCPILSYLK